MINYMKNSTTRMVNKDSTQKTQIFGHVARLPNNAPAKPALYESIRKTKEPKGKRQTIVINVLQKQLKELNIVFRKQ